MIMNAAALLEHSPQPEAALLYFTRVGEREATSAPQISPTSDAMHWQAARQDVVLTEVHELLLLRLLGSLRFTLRIPHNVQR